MEPVGAAKESCLAMVELVSVPAGAEALDIIVKEVPVDVLMARPVSPGHAVVFFEGDVESARRGRDRVRAEFGDRLIDDLVLARPHPHIAEGLLRVREVASIDAYGILQAGTLSSTIVGADAALKASEVELIELRLAMGLGGQGFFSITGEMASVTFALEAARTVVGDRLVDDVLLPAPHSDSIRHFADPRSPFSDIFPAP